MVMLQKRIHHTLAQAPTAGPTERIFKWGGGGLMQTCKCEQTRVVLENFKFKSSEKDINASKIAKSDINL